MKLLINFSSLKEGGGQNVAMNFLQVLSKDSFNDIKIYFFAAEGSTIQHYLKNKFPNQCYVVPQNAIKRILFELLFSRIIFLKLGIQIVYSYFGFGFFPKSIPQITGSADSNLFYPEVDFWNNYHGIAKIKKSIKDQYRIWGLKRATAVVFENKTLEKKSVKLYDLKKTTTIKPSINITLSKKSFKLPKYIGKNVPICLFLCGWQLNKNIMLIPDIAFDLKRQNMEFHFLLTAPLDNSIIHRDFQKKIDINNVNEMITITGQVSKDEIPALYSQIDFVCLLSKLESFSNNIIEAWYFKKPLIIANESWARGICKNAALYVDRESSLAIASLLIKCLNDHILVAKVLQRSAQLLETYPSIEVRMKQEIAFIKHVFKNS